MKRIGQRGFLGVIAIALTTTVFAGCAPDVNQLTPQQQVDTIISFVEAERGHHFLVHPTVQFIPEAQFVQDVLASLNAAEPGIDADEVAFKALGWMNPTDSLFDKYKIAFGGTVVGFYDPATKVLEVRGSTMTPYRREVVAHELTHALDDQLHNLNVSFGDGVLAEAQQAFLVAVEGDAVRTQQAYVAQMSLPDQLADINEQLSFQIDPELLSVPLALLALAQTSYLQGPNFIAGLNGNAGIDAMFSRYPNTTEQAWNVAKYLANETAVPVATPPASGTIAATGRWGRFNMSMLLAEGLDLDATVNPVTDGWAGDSFVTWTSGSSHCIRIDTKSDTAAQSTNLRSALTTWSANHAGSTVQAIDTTTARLTSCA